MNWLTPPAWASDTGIIEIIQEPPDKPPLIDPAVPAEGGCTPRITITMAPPTSDHSSGAACPGLIEAHR